MNQEEIIKRLKEPFSNKEIEWKLQVTTQDKTRGMAVAYLDARAIQNRLDEVVGAFNWMNTFSPWQDKAQICGISIYNTERNEWVTKYDGAENSDIEPIKGGLSDSFKRTACLWGIGRYLYQMDGVWVDVEPKGKSFAIKQDQYAKLEAEYNKAVANQHDATACAFDKQSAISSATQDVTNGQPAVAMNSENKNDIITPTDGYTVKSVKASGKSSQLLELVSGNGEVISAYIKANNSDIKVGMDLKQVKLERKNSSYGDYNLISSYQLAA